MTLTFTTTPADYLAALNRILSRSVFGKNFSKYGWIAISILAWLSVILPFIKFQEFGIGFWVRLFFALVVTIGWPFFYNRYTDGVFSGIINKETLKGYAGKVSVTITQEFIESATQTTTSRAKWNDVYSVEIGGDHIFVFFTPLIVTPIPSIAFGSVSEQDDFIKAIEARIEIKRSIR